MALNMTALFTTLGKIFADQEAVNAFRNDTASFNAIIDQFDGEAIELRRAIANYFYADQNRQASLISSNLASQQVAQTYITEFVSSDINLPAVNLESVLQELIKQMIDTNVTVQRSTISAGSPSYSGSGNMVLAASVLRTQGDYASQQIYAEGLRLECTTAGVDNSVFTVAGQEVQTDQLASDWPLGQSNGATITAVGLTDSLLTNGGFDDETVEVDVPDNWIVNIGTPGTTIKLTNYEQQTVTITGSPTTGYYRLAWSNASSQVVWTDRLNFDATGDDVQAALRTIPGLESVTVTTTGTGPNYTHTIEFIGQSGNVNQVTVPQNTTGATITPATTVAGSANAFTGKAMEFDSDGSQLTEIYQEVSLSPSTTYALNAWMKADVVPAAGVIKFRLLDGISGTVVTDESGNPCEISITCSGLTTAFVGRNGFLRTPKTLPDTVYLQIKITTAVSNTSSIFVDQVVLVPAQQFYTMGPFVTLFSGNVSPVIATAEARATRITIGFANDYSAKFQLYFERNFKLRELGLQLPSAASPTIADSLIA